MIIINGILIEKKNYAILKQIYANPISKSRNAKKRPSTTSQIRQIRQSLGYYEANDNSNRNR